MVEILGQRSNAAVALHHLKHRWWYIAPGALLAGSTFLRIKRRPTVSDVDGATAMSSSELAATLQFGNYGLAVGLSLGLFHDETNKEL